MNKKIFVVDEHAMDIFAGKIAQHCQSGVVIYLSGQLGAGKTTFVRGFLKQLGFHGKVKSPTYTLVEPYHFDHHTVYHFDLYRVHDPQEIAYIGLEEYFHLQTIVLVEWPEHGGGYLPKADLHCYIGMAENGREVELKAESEMGLQMIKDI